MKHLLDKECIQIDKLQGILIDIYGFITNYEFLFSFIICHYIDTGISDIKFGFLVDDERCRWLILPHLFDINFDQIKTYDSISFICQNIEVFIAVVNSANTPNTYSQVYIYLLLFFEINKECIFSRSQDTRSLFIIEQKKLWLIIHIHLEVIEH